MDKFDCPYLYSIIHSWYILIGAQRLFQQYFRQILAVNSTDGTETIPLTCRKSQTTYHLMHRVHLATSVNQTRNFRGDTLQVLNAYVDVYLTTLQPRPRPTQICLRPQCLRHASIQHVKNNSEATEYNFDQLLRCLKRNRLSRDLKISYD